MGLLHFWIGNGCARVSIREKNKKTRTKKKKRKENNSDWCKRKAAAAGATVPPHPPHPPHPPPPESVFQKSSAPFAPTHPSPLRADSLNAIEGEFPWTPKIQNQKKKKGKKKIVFGYGLVKKITQQNGRRNFPDSYWSTAELFGSFCLFVFFLFVFFSSGLSDFFL